MKRLVPIAVLLIGVFVVLGGAAILHSAYQRSALEVEALRLRAATQHLAMLSPAAPADPGLLEPAASEAAATAGLVEFVKAAVEGAGGAVLALQPKQLENVGDGDVGLRTQFVADVAGLQKTLHAIESARPALIVDSVLVRGRPQVTGNEPVKLDITLEVRAFRRPGPA